jgi:hypothetical protein
MPHAEINVPGLILVGRFSSDPHWPVLGDRWGTQNPYTLRGDTFENYLALGFRKRTEKVDQSDLLVGLLIDPLDAFMADS